MGYLVIAPNKDVVWSYQSKAIIMRLLHPITREENNESVKKHPFYCYKAQLQFVGWLKQHLRRTDYPGQPGLARGNEESFLAIWQIATEVTVHPSLKNRRKKGQLGKFLGNLVLLSTSLGRPLWQSLKLGRRDTRGSQDWPQRVNNIIIIISSIIIVIIVIAIVIMAVAGELPGSISQDSFWVRR